MHHPHPWRELRELAHLIVHWRSDLPPRTHALTDGERIWIREGLTQVQRRCAVAHELTHVRRGHTECQPRTVEESVRRETARRLVPDVHDLAEILAWAHTIGEAADELWVTTSVLMCRLESLHPAERAIINARLEAK